jgi:MazG family protein
LATITPYLQEETFEALEAIATGSSESIREELGDLFYLLVFASALGGKSGLSTDLPVVLREAADKLVRRHPHVFGSTDIAGAKAAFQQWEEIKKQELQAKTVLGRRPSGLPALTTAFRIQEKAAAVHFEWSDVRGALAKIREEIDELESVLNLPGKAGESRLSEELGDILYSVVNVSRYLKVDPELALRRSIAKFVNRFRFIEAELARLGKTPGSSSLEEMDALWNDAKRRGIR